MRIPCPHCGERSLEEFAYLGDATVARPAPDAGLDAFVDYVYRRDNPSGAHQEFWYHSGGCRRWLVVTRDLRSHAILGVAAATERTRGQRPGERT
jgi:sarcosine oxidase subunit delta